MKEQCKRCEAGPRDGGGHDDLFTHSFVGANIVLKCRACDSFWLRTGTPGKYEWAPGVGTRGALVPCG